MHRKAFRLIAAAVLALFCVVGAQAQEDDALARKKPQPKAVEDAKAKVLAQKRAQAKARAKARAKADAEARKKAVDINRASKEELLKLKDLTPAMADAIIAKRPYKSKAELVTKNAISQGTYLIISKQVAAK